MLGSLVSTLPATQLEVQKSAVCVMYKEYKQKNMVYWSAGWH